MLKGGRSLERQVSLKSGARVEDALERLGHEVIPIDVGADLVDRLTDERPDLAFVALHGRDGEDGTVQELLEVMGIPLHRLRRVGLHPRRRQGAGQARDARRRDPDPRLLRVQRDRVPGARRGPGAARRSRSGCEFPIVVKPAGQGSALGIKFARTPADVPAALVAAFSYDRKVLLERYVAGRDLAVSIIDEDGVPRRAADRRGGARAGGLLRLRVPLRDRAHAVRLPGRARRGGRRARERDRARGLRAARLLGLRARRPDARGTTPASCTCSRPTRSPG